MVVINNPGPKTKTIHAAQPKPKTRKEKQASKALSSDSHASHAPRSFKTLPAWIKPIFTLTVIPTILNYYGAQDDPWDLNADKFSEVLQGVIDQIFPEECFTVDQKHQIYRIVCLLSSIYCTTCTNSGGR